MLNVIEECYPIRWLQGKNMVVVKMTTREAMTADDFEARMWWWWRWRQSLRRWQQMTRRQGRLQLMGFSSTRLTRLRAAPPDNSFEHHVCAGGSSTVPRCSKTAFDCVNAQNILDVYLHNLFETTCTTFDWQPSTFYQRLPRFIVKLGWPRANILVLHKVHILTLDCLGAL